MTKKSIVILLIGAAALIILALVSFKMEKIPRSGYGNKITPININGQKISAEIADTEEKRTLGLSGRAALCSDCAMLFIFNGKSAHSFWMKDMRFDLDMIWISGNEVVYLAKNVPHDGGTAEIISPSVSADKVLEVNAGMSDRVGINIGDKIGFEK